MRLTDYIFYRIPFEVENYWRHCKSFFSRGRKGYAKTDLWSFDLYLCKIIGYGLIDLSNNLSGYPSELESTGEWKSILNKMASGFLGYVQEEEYFSENETFREFETRKKKAEIKLNESLALFKRYFINLWD